MTSNSESILLKGGSVLVTGATGDIGRAIVNECVQAGAAVFAAGRNEAKLAALVNQYESRVIPLNYDVTDEKAVKDAGMAKLQGRDYVVKDGDCIYFHFNV